MSRNDVLWADRLLVDVREQADPTEQDAARNFAGIEQRLQLSAAHDDTTSGAGDGAAASTGTLLQLRSGATPAPTAPATLTSSASGWKSAAVLGRWLAIGTTSALIGYLGGRTESRQELAELVREQQAQQLQLDQLEQQAQQRERQQTDLQRQQELAQQTPPLQLQQTDLQRQRELQPSPTPRQLPATPPRLRQRPRPAAAPSAIRPTALRAAQPQKQNQPPNQQLREAIELLQRAEAALRQGDAFAASLLLSDLDRSASADLLREERLVTRALVSCALGDASAAGSALRELEQLNPESIYRARLEGSCAEKKRQPLSKEPTAPH
jgi:hypothetical protein